MASLPVGPAISHPRPRALRAAVGAVLTEATAIGAGGLWGLADLLVRGSPDLPVALSLVGLALALAAALTVGARALWRGRRGVRGPVITWQLLQAATAAALLGTPGRAWVAAAALLVAAAVVVLLLLPTVVAVTTRRGPTPPGAG